MRPRKAREVRLLVSKAEAQVREVEGVLTITVPSIVDHEVMAIVF